jgi:hypothetical protein
LQEKKRISRKDAKFTQRAPRKSYNRADKASVVSNK